MAPLTAEFATPSLQRRPSDGQPGDVEPHRVRRHALAKLLRADGSPEGYVDWSPWYLTDEEDMGQSGEQGQIISLLNRSLQAWVREKEWPTTLVACDQFVQGRDIILTDEEMNEVKDGVIARKDEVIARKDEVIARKDARLAALEAELAALRADTRDTGV